MIEFNDGTFSDLMPLTDAFREAEKHPELVKSVHVVTGEKEIQDRLRALQKEAEEIQGQQFQDRLSRVEAMLSAIIIHFNVPYKGILKVPSAD